MGHTKPQDLDDPLREFAEIRKLDGLKEKSPGIFYYKGAGFLHFHDKDGKRWADVKVHDGWRELNINFNATSSQRKGFVDQVKKAHQSIIKRE